MSKQLTTATGWLLERLTSAKSSATPSQQHGYRALPTAPTRQFDAFFLVPLPDEEAARELEQGLLQRVRDETVAEMERKPTTTDPLVPFHRLESVHFARLLILRNAGRTPQLCFALDYDGAEGDPHCSAISAHAALMAQLEGLPGLKQIFAYCSRYDGRRELAPFLERHRLHAATPYVGTQGRSVRQIREEAELRREAEAVLQAQLSPSPEEALEAVRKKIGHVVPPFPPQPDLTWALYGSLTKFALPRLPLVPLLCALVPRFRWLERNDPQFQPQSDAQVHARRAAVAPDEDRFLQNELTHVVEIKDGLLRRTVLKLVFGVLSSFSKYEFNHGELGGIPSIHFARWVLGPHGRVIFLSNYDGSWESYLGAFVDKASLGLTAVWSNTKLFPRTRWLTGEGSRAAPRFLAWVRAHQQRCHVWYSAYPTLTVDEINANTELRRGMAQPAGVDATTWLSRMGNVDRFAVGARDTAEQSGDRSADPSGGRVQTPPVDEQDVQGLILRGYGDRSEAAYLLLRIKADTDKVALRACLSQLPVTSAEDARRQQKDAVRLNVAFTYTGLVALGLEPGLCNAFSTAFVQGSRHPQRLATTGDPDPDTDSSADPVTGLPAERKWLWGGSQSDVHIALLIYADSDKIHQTVTSYRGLAEKMNLDVVKVLHASPMGAVSREHFGFRDGISQPRVRGVRGTMEGPNTIAPGEVLLGLPDAYGLTSAAPEGSQGFRFGHNGSYMVLRQLEQHVETFWRYCEAEGERNGTDAIRVASQMVGRWPSGASLVRYPDRDPAPGNAATHNDFDYLEAGPDNDRYGSRCPFGAHVRRANPRDWNLGEIRDESRQIANQHRIARRGRPYGVPVAPSMEAEAVLEEVMRPGDGAAVEATPSDRGMVFICFNADIERQFEFVQQNWCNSPKFAGQSSDADPLLGQSAAARRGENLPHGMTLQSEPGKAPGRLPNLKRFVEVRGSAYFFMPSLTALRLLPHFEATPAGNPAAKYERVPPDEQEHTERLGSNIKQLIVNRDSNGLARRDAHPKMHAFVDATLEIERDLPDDLRHGLFAHTGRSFRGVVRLSNQEKDPQPDTKGDTRGLALKLLAAPGPRVLDGEELLGQEGFRHHDFLFLSTPTFVARDVAEFGALVQVIVNGPLRLDGMRAIPRAIWPFIRHLCSLSVPASLLEIPYFSVVPYMLGPRPVKYELRPQTATASPKGTTPDFLRERLAEQLSVAEYCFDLLVQEYVDERQTPVEDATVLWTGKQPRKVATLRLPRQSPEVYDTPERRKLGEDATFNPARCLPEHRPIGGINRARHQIHLQIAKFRHDRNGVDAAEVRKRLDALLKS